MIFLLNILNLISIIFSVAFQILLVRYFGAALQTDVYYLSLGIIQFINGTFAGFLTDLYIPIYNDVKVRSEEQSKKFTGAVFVLMLIIGLLISVIVFILAPYLVKLFASGFTPNKVAFSAKLVRILCIAIVFTSLTTVLNATLQANLFMSITYFTAIITPFSNLFALLFFAKQYGIEAVIYAMVFSSILNFLILLNYLKRKIGWEFSNPFIQADITYLLKQNIPIRAGNLIYLLKSPVTTNVLSYFPTGYITLFNYSDRILAIFFNITNSPILQILYAKASNLLSRKKIGELKSVLLSTIKSNTVLFIGVIIPTVVLFKEVFGFLFAQKVTPGQISVMYSLFLALIPFYLTLSFEMPFVNITFALKKGLKVLQIAIVFIILYSLFLLGGIKLLGIYIIPIALFFAQLYNTITYARFVNKNLHVIDLNMLKTIGKFSIFVALLLSLNAISRNHFLYSIYINLLLVLLWLIFTGKETITAFQFLTEKGEVK
jgi:putative peptidoglycan lipid II flippase